MGKILITPTKYIQGSGELDKIGGYVDSFGKRALLLISKSGYKRKGKDIVSSLKNSGIQAHCDYFNGECSKVEVERLRKTVADNQLDMIIGVGGGKILDTAKAVAYYEKLPVVICPTIASTDAPCSALSVLYTEDGVFDEYLFLPANPNVVLVDTDVVCKSPVRLTVSGMGDALATYFEARAVKTKCAANFAGGKTTLAAYALAELCFETLMTEGLKAKLALEAGVCSKAVEDVIEANTLLSGIGFESVGLAAAHAIHNGFTVMDECHHLYHGEKVAFGTLVQLVLENSSEDELFEVMEFCIEMGLPVTLKDMGVAQIDHDKIREVAKAACAEGETIYNMPFDVNEEMVYQAILAADKIGSYLKGEY